MTERPCWYLTFRKFQVNLRFETLFIAFKEHVISLTFCQSSFWIIYSSFIIRVSQHLAFRFSEAVGVFNNRNNYNTGNMRKNSSSSSVINFKNMLFLLCKVVPKYLLLRIFLRLIFELIGSDLVNILIK